MKKVLLVFGSIFFIIVGFVAVAFFVQHKKTRQYEILFDHTKPQKKILIFTSSGGQGHTSATQALHAYLDADYQIQDVHVLRDVLGPVDFIYTLTFGTYHSEDVYNYFLTRQHVWMIRVMVLLGRVFFWLRASAMQQLIHDYCAQQKPDVVISVIPMVNGVTLHAVQALNIPFMVIPTDLDAHMYTHQIYKPTYKKFAFNVAYDVDQLLKTIARTAVPASNRTQMGFPVRPEFLKQFDLDVLKQKHNIPQNKPVVMMLMGGLGSQDTLTFAHELARVHEPMHVLICIGKDEAMRNKLKTVAFNNGVTTQIIEFTKDIAELMAVSDLFITKSGGLSVNEALYMNLPMLINGIVPALEWEQFNRTFVVDNGFGTIVHDITKLRFMVEDLLRNPKKLEQFKTNIQRLEKRNPQEYITRVVQMLVGN